MTLSAGASHVEGDRLFGHYQWRHRPEQALLYQIVGEYYLKRGRLAGMEPYVEKKKVGFR